jgi:hypothetical protein
MSPAHEPAESGACQDEVLTIEISQPLPCGVAHCDQPARRGRIERDPETGALWRLLPICEKHLASLAAGATVVLRDQRHDARAGK